MTTKCQTCMYPRLCEAYRAWRKAVILRRGRDRRKARQEIEAMEAELTNLSATSPRSETGAGAGRYLNNDNNSRRGGIKQTVNAKCGLPSVTWLI